MQANTKKLFTSLCYIALAMVYSGQVVAADKNREQTVPVEEYLQFLQDKQKAQGSAAEYKRILFCLSKNCPSTTDLEKCSLDRCGFDINKDSH